MSMLILWGINDFHMSTSLMILIVHLSNQQCQGFKIKFKLLDAYVFIIVKSIFDLNSILIIEFFFCEIHATYVHNLIYTWIFFLWNPFNIFTCTSLIILSITKDTNRWISLYEEQRSIVTWECIFTILVLLIPQSSTFHFPKFSCVLHPLPLNLDFWIMKDPNR